MLNLNLCKAKSFSSYKSLLDIVKEKESLLKTKSIASKQRRGILSEILVFEKLLNSSSISEKFMGLYHRAKIFNQEVDGLLVFKDLIVLIEVKSYLSTSEIVFTETQKMKYEKTLIAIQNKTDQDVEFKFFAVDETGLIQEIELLI